MKLSAKQLERLIARCLTALEDAVRRSRTENVRYTTGVGAPLSFLEQLAVDKEPLERFSKALEDHCRRGDQRLITLLQDVVATT